MVYQPLDAGGKPFFCLAWAGLRAEQIGGKHWKLGNMIQPYSTKKNRIWDPHGSQQIKKRIKGSKQKTWELTVFHSNLTHLSSTVARIGI
jgi:hypothetical protein